MNDSQHNWLVPGQQLTPVLVMDDWLGPVTALIKCEATSEFALIYLVAWQEPDLKKRIFALRAVDADVAQTYLQNVSKDFCDLTRKQQESDALFSAADPVSHLVAASSSLIVSESAVTTRNPPMIPWRELDTADFSHWEKQMVFYEDE